MRIVSLILAIVMVSGILVCLAPKAEAAPVFNGAPYLNHRYPLGSNWWVNDTSGDIIWVYADVADATTSVEISYSYCDPVAWGGLCAPPSTTAMNLVSGTLYRAQMTAHSNLDGSYPAECTIHYYIVATGTGTTNYPAVGTIDIIPLWPPTATNVYASVSPPSPVYPGSVLTVSGNASYWNNTFPAESGNVTVTVNPGGTKFYGTTNGTGNFTVPVTAPMTAGNYTLNVTVYNTTTNRNVTGYAAQMLLDVMPVKLTISLYLNTTTALPGTQVLVNGTVNMSNGALPVGSNITVKINETGAQWNATVNATGGYSVQILAPNTTGNFHVNATIQNSTYGITGWNETALTIVAAPLADLVASQSKIYTQGTLIEGNIIHINATIDNLGNAQASNAIINVSLDSEILKSETATISAGGNATVYVQWNSTSGSHNISVRADPQGLITESSETNNLAWKLIQIETDTDGDGISDAADTDDDNDGYNDTAENQVGTDPLDDASVPSDIDDDFIPDSLDDDRDGDGVVNLEDEFPSDPDEWSDFDGDGIGDNADLDDDGDGYPDTIDPQLYDTDNDGLRNDVDLDDDGDGVPDASDTRPLDTDNDGQNNDVDTDDDNDGISDIEEDADGDGIVDEGETDYLNPDTDGDGVPDGEDYAPLDPEVTESSTFTLGDLLIPVMIFLTVLAVIFVYFFLRPKVQK